VIREDDRERKWSALKQLKDYLSQPENSKTILRSADSSDSLLLVLQDIFYERTSKDVKQEAARCLGIVGTVMSSDAQRYFQWLFAKLTAAHTDEGKILLLFALLTTLKHEYTVSRLEEYMPMIMDHCQNVLENADMPELLRAVVDVILYISESHPHVFSSHYRDTVDILVGWHIDSTQKEELTQYASDSLVAFHQFWVSDLSFSITLLGQFLEDMEAYSEDLALGMSGQAIVDDEMPHPNECVNKIMALLRVFTTVVLSLGEFFGPDKSPHITCDYIIETMERIIRYVDTSMKQLYTENILIEGTINVY